MRDLHSHILYGVDDGARVKEDSINMLKTLEKKGVTDVVVTPHYIIGTDYNSNNKVKKSILEELQKETNIKLYLGNEVYIDNNIYENVLNGNISTINNSRYILIEFPLNYKLDNAKGIIFDLRNKGFIPIIAHPERYTYMNVDDFKVYIDMGCLMQGNIMSLNNKYGYKVNRRLKKLIKIRYIHFLGTDIHHDMEFNLDKLLKKVKGLLSSDEYLDICENNFKRVVNDLDIN